MIATINQAPFVLNLSKHARALRHLNETRGSFKQGERMFFMEAFA